MLLAGRTSRPDGWDRKTLGSTGPEMVHLCVSISNDGLRLESVQKGSSKSSRNRRRKQTDMATLRRNPKPRSAASRQDRGSCSSTASCPVFSGPYSDQEEDPPLRRQSSPVLKGSLTSLQHLTTKTPKNSLSSLQGSTPSLQGSLPSLQNALHTFQGSFPNLRGAISRLKRRSLGSLDNASVSNSDRSASPSLQSVNGSMSDDDDDGSWDTNSWSSGATCLLRTPLKQDSTETPKEKDGKDSSEMSSKAEPEVIYQNLIFPRPALKSDNKVNATEATPVLPRKETQSNISSCKKPPPLPRNNKTEDKRKFSQFLNEVTCRVLKTNDNSPQPVSTFRHRYPSPPPPPPSTPCPQATTAFQSSNHTPTAPPGTSMWYSPTSSNIQTIRERASKDIKASIHQWSKTLPSCKVLEPGDVLRKVMGDGPSHPEHNLEPCTKLQAQPSSGRLYLETDIDRVRQLDELVANGTLGKKQNETGLEKGTERLSENRISREKNGNSAAMDSVKERPRMREGPWDREKDGRVDRGRDKGRRAVPNSYESILSQTMMCTRNNPGAILNWSDGMPQMSYRSTSLPRPANVTGSDEELQPGTSTLRKRGDAPLVPPRQTPSPHLPNMRRKANKRSYHDQKEDLRKRLSYTAHKLEMVESEFDSTRQYLETELRRAQEELEKFTDKLRRIQSSYAALQRINQDLEDKMHRTSQLHEEEKRALSREIIVLNNHLMEAKITINKLREDNDLYRKDCNLAAQLLQCSKSHYRVHKMSELPLDFQERLSSHIEKHGSSGATMVCHSSYSDAVPTSLIAQVLEKPEPGSSCPVSRSSSPQRDGDFLSGTGSTDQLNRRVAYKTSDLYCSDTALYCPERWQDTERRQSVDLHGPGILQLHIHNSTDSNPEEAYHSGSFSTQEPASSFHHHDEFAPGSLPMSSSYSSFSLASDDKGVGGGGSCRITNSTLSSSHQGLYTDWRDGGDYKSLTPYEKDGSSFPKSLSIQHMAVPRSPQKGSSPSYTRTASCFSEPYHSSSPRLASSHSMSSTSGLAQGHSSRGDVQLSEDDLVNRWRQLSVEDVNTLSSSSYRDLSGRVSPYSFSERHFALGPSKSKNIYSSFQEGDDIFHSRVLDQCFGIGPHSPSHSPKPMEHRKKEKGSAMYSQDPDCGLFLSGSSKDKEGGRVTSGGGSSKKDYVNLSGDSSGESLHQSSLEASSLQHYPSPRPVVRPRPSSSSALTAGPALPKKTSPRYQKFGSTGLTRKDSLTKAQLYGTLLN